MSLLNDSIALCQRCDRKVKMGSYRLHLESRCKDHTVNPNLPSKVTLKDILGKPATSPATPVELKAAQHLVRRLICQDSNTAEVIKVPTIVHLEIID